MERSLRRHGQFLVAVGAALGVLVGVVLGLAAHDAQTSTAVGAPAREGAAALSAALPSSQPTAGQPAGSGRRPAGNESFRSQHAESPDRPGKGHSKARMGGERRQDKSDRHDHGEGKQDKAAHGKGKNQ